MYQTIEELLISKGEIERIYKGELSLYLWRALHKTSTVENPLYPDFEERVLPNGNIRLADVTTTQNSCGIIHIKAQLGKGTSLFDCDGTFGFSNWTYFEIPKGTKIPNGLIITKDNFNSKYNATHYTLSPNYTMPKLQFIKLLDELARNAKTRKAMIKNG